MEKPTEITLDEEVCDESHHGDVKIWLGVIKTWEFIVCLAICEVVFLVMVVLPHQHGVGSVMGQSGVKCVLAAGVDLLRGHHVPPTAANAASKEEDKGEEESKEAIFDEAMVNAKIWSCGVKGEPGEPPAGLL